MEGRGICSACQAGVHPVDVISHMAAPIGFPNGNRDAILFHERQDIGLRPEIIRLAIDLSKKIMT